MVQLERLSPQAGADLLHHLGVKGSRHELETTATEFQGHALALRLLGNYLAALHHGDIRQRDKVRQLTVEEKHGGHAVRVMEAYVNWFEQDEKYQPELTLLHLVGLFDRPAPVGALEALVAEGVGNAKGLLNLQGLVNLTPAQQTYTLNHLEKLNLLTINHSTAALPEIPAHLPGFAGVESIDAHPLVREFFGNKFRQERPTTWQQCHATLYEYYKALPEKELPDTLEEMEPLFSAVAHGCRSGLHQEALVDVYWKKIKRGNEHYCTKKLGAFGSDLTALSWFFERLWDKPAALLERDKAMVLSWAGFRLRALGRLGEAAQPMKASLEINVFQKDWKTAAINATNLSELHLTAGQVGPAVRYGEEGLTYADRSGKWERQMINHTAHADALHQAGQLEAAARLFAEAEGMQRESQPGYRYLYSLPGFRYCDLLLGEGRVEEVLERAKFALEISKENNWLLDIALDHLTLGKAYHHLSQTHPTEAHRQNAASYLDEAVAGLRKAGTLHNLPWGLLARATWHRHQQDWPAAGADLAEVLDIAKAGGMRLYLCDYHLEMARLRVAMGRLEEAREHVGEAGRLVEETGYHRRDGEVRVLREVLGMGGTGS